MPDIRNVLCPVDRSDISQRALTVGAALARWYDARVRVLEVVSVALPPIASAPAAVRGLSIEMRGNLLAELDHFSAPARPFGVPMHFEVEEGDVAAAILNEATELPADLIVLGTHGRRGFEHFAMGSVAERMIRKARCPVITVPPGAAADPAENVPFKRIVCAVDFSNASLRGLEYAFSLARESDARLTLAHVIDWPHDDSLPDALKKAVGSARREWEDEKRRQLGMLVPEAAGNWCDPEPTLLTGSPAREILNLARARQSDLIVMGVHSRGPLDLAVFGSTTHQVVREAPCAVLTIRGKG
jgi:nucleotide-binding universal stress UspA family protein